MSASGSVYTPSLGLQRVEITQGEAFRAYWAQVELENVLNGNRSQVDQFAAYTSASFYSLFVLSGSVSDQLGDGAVIGSEWNPGPNRIIQEVLAWAVTSGSGGVTTLDALVQGSPGAAAFTSIFGPLGGPANAAMRVAVSASLGNFGVAKSGQSLMTSGSNTLWPAGSLLKVVATTAAGAAGPSGQKGLTVQVRWTPSGSYANGNPAP